MRAIISAAIFAMSLFNAGCKEATTSNEPIRPVLWSLVEPSQLRSTIAVGTVGPRYKTDLSFRVLGRLITRPVNVGQAVNKGDLLAAIDPTVLKLAVQSAQADLARSQAQLTNASANERRQRTLVALDSASKESLDNAVQIRADAEASVARAKASLTKAIEELGYAQLKTDFAGVVTAVSADVGQVVSVGQSVATVARPDIREAIVDIGPDFPIPLRIGLPFTVSLPMIPMVQVDGQIREIAPQADPMTRTQRVRIALKDPPDAFRLGATVTARFATGEDPTLRVPPSALLIKGGETFVWVLDAHADTVSLRKIEVSQDANGIRVIKGLHAGTRIVTAGVHSLKQGQHVRLDKDQTP